MKIISNFSDYYDSIQKYHDDSGILYFRKEISLTKELPQLANQIIDRYSKFFKITRPTKHSGSYPYYSTGWRFKDNRNNRISVDWVRGNNSYQHYQVKYLIIFCGKLYPIVRFKTISPDPACVANYLYLYTANEFFEFIDKQDIQLNTSSDKTVIDTFFSVSGSEHDVDFLIENKITNIVLKVKEDAPTIFQDSYKTYEVLLNPKLSDYSFYKVLDAYSCYQELDMWLSSRLAYPQNIMIEVDDKSKVEKHGFDTKYGFRTRPNKG
jgi:hypothetical protein